MTTRHWTPTAADLRAIRAYAAASEGNFHPQAIHIEIGERTRLAPGPHETSVNVLLVNDPDDGDDDFLEGTDLHDFVRWADFKRFGARLTEDGRAIVDFYVYEKDFGDRGELITNVQAHVVTRNGKPTIIGFSATGEDFKRV